MINVECIISSSFSLFFILSILFLNSVNSHPLLLQFVLCLIAAIIYAVNTVWLAKSWYLLPSDDVSVKTYESKGLTGFLNSLGIVSTKEMIVSSFFSLYPSFCIINPR